MGAAVRGYFSGESYTLRFTCNRPVIHDKKRGYNWIVFPCIQTEEYYIRIDVRTVYLQDHMTRTPSLANPSIQMMPPGTPFTALLHPPRFRLGSPTPSFSAHALSPPTQTSPQCPLGVGSQSKISNSEPSLAACLPN